MARRWLLLLLAPAVGAFLACASFDADEPVDGNDGGNELEGSLGDGSSEASTDAGPQLTCNVSRLDPAPSTNCLDGGQAVDLMSSKSNCGSCGHSCGDFDCAAGLCVPARLLSTPTPPLLGTLSATHAYYVIGPDVQRTPFAGGTVDVVARFEEANSYMRSFVREDDRLYVEGLRGTTVTLGVVPDSTKDSGIEPLLATTGQGLFSATTNDLFVVDYSSIYRVPKTGAASRSLVQLNQASDTIVGPKALGDTLAWIVVEGAQADGGAPKNRLYLATGGNNVLRATNLGAVAQVLAIDATHVYWAERDTKRVMRVERAGTSAPTVVAEWPGTNDFVKSMALSADDVHWVITPDGQAGADATIYRAPKCAENGNVVVVAHPGGEYYGLLVADVTHLYYGGLSGIWRVAR